MLASLAVVTGGANYLVKKFIGHLFPVLSLRVFGPVSSRAANWKHHMTRPSVSRIRREGRLIASRRLLAGQAAVRQASGRAVAQWAASGARVRS